MAETTFGDMLRVARKRAGFSTMAAFARALQLRGFPYNTEKSIEHWEKNRRKPYQEGERPIFISLLQVLAENGGFDHAGEIDTMLAALDRPTLSDGEKETYFPTLKDISPIENLPEQPPYDRLIGRDDELAVLNAELLDVGGKSVVVISGLGGIGKTAVAYEVVRRSMRSGRFEKLAWESAKSEEFSGVGIQQRHKQTISFHQILLGYVRQLGYESLTNLPPEVLQTRLREIFQSHSYLIVLDNLETLEAAQDVARQLYGMVSPGRSRILITSRKRLADETYVFDYFIRGLSEPDSMSLIRDETEARGAEMLLKAGSTLLHRIYTTTGGMPLALKLIVSQYLLGIALDDELDRLEKAVDEEELYRFIYFAIWQKLSILAQKLLVGLATFAAPTLRSLLQPVSELNDSEFLHAVPELVRASLLEVTDHPLSAQKRYDVHAMTRWFVNAPLTDLWNDQKRTGQNGTSD